MQGNGANERTALLLHAGIADSRMWRPQVASLGAAGFRVLAPDLRGFGDRRLEPGPYAHVRDVAALLEGPAVVVGNSLGGRVALELAISRPELVERVVLIAPGLPGWDWSAETRAGWEAEWQAFQQGDLDAAAETSLRLWVDGPRRAPDDVDAGVRAAVREMILRSYAQQAGIEEDEEEPLPGGPVGERLGEVRCPTLVLVGEEDVADMQGIAAHLATAIHGATLASIPGAGHLPSLERPAETDAHLLPFLTAG